MPDLIHYTLNTGHWRYSPRHEVANEVISAIDNLTIPGQHALPGSEDLVFDLLVQGKFGRASFFIKEVYQAKKQPIALCGLVWKQETLHKTKRRLEQVCAAAGAPCLAEHRNIPSCPEKVPWLGIVLFEGIALLGERIADVADFERCLAWTLIEKFNQ